MIKKNFKALVALAAVTAMVITGVTPVAAITGNKEVNTQVASNKQLRNVMYYGDWSIWGGEGNFYPQDIPAEDLTHLNFAFMDFDENGAFRWCEPMSLGHPMGIKDLPYDESDGYTGGALNGFQVLKQQNPNLKIGVSIGGWSKSNDFSKMAANPTYRANFVKNSMDFIRYMNMDFVDLDWEYPGADQVRQPDKCDNKNDEGTVHASAADKQNYILLLEDLRVALDKQGKELGKTYELSAALPMAISKQEDGIDVKRMFELLDYGNIMTYDAAGAWDTVSGHQAALYDNPNSPYAGKGFSVDSSVKNYISKGAPKEKIVIGAAFYTRGWEKVSNNGPDKSLPGLYGTAEKVNKDADGSTISAGAKNFAPIANGDGGRHGGVWPWRQHEKLKSDYSGLKEYWDDTAKAPYLYSESTGAFFTYDNPKSIGEKTKYVHQEGLGGVISWMASQDKETTGTKRNELTNAIKVGLFGSGELPKFPVNDLETLADLKVTATTPQWGGGSELTFTVTANSKLECKDPAVSRAEKSYKAIKFPKFYISTKGITLSAGEGAGTVTKEGDYYVVDLGGVYDGKVIKPANKAYTFKIKTSEKVNKVEDAITRVTVTQRMWPSAPEFAETVLLEGVSIPEDVNLDGVVDVVDLSAVAAKYNLKVGQKGFDAKCDINKDSIIDLYDLTRVARKIESTNPNPDPDPDPNPDPDPSNAWDANKEYKQGDIVSYNGKTYRAKWYSKGEQPGQPWNAWEEVK